MSHRRTIDLALVIALTVCLVGLPWLRPRALGRPDVGRPRAPGSRSQEVGGGPEAVAALSARAEQASAELDRVLADQQKARDRLGSRALTMYRLGETSYVSVLFGATTYEQFTSRWDLLTRMNRQDAADLLELKAARAKADRGPSP